MVIVPDREALTGFVTPWVPVAVLCQGTEQLFPPTSHDYQWLRHIPAGLARALGSLPWQIHGNGSLVMSKGSCCHRQGSRKGTARLSQGAAGHSSRGRDGLWNHHRRASGGCGGAPGTHLAVSRFVTP